jgi:hypothetical protein
MSTPEILKLATPYLGFAFWRNLQYILSPQRLIRRKAYKKREPFTAQIAGNSEAIP